MTALRLAQLAPLCALLVASHAAAQIACGDVLGPGGSFTADADIGPCVENPAVRIVGPVKVDFAGFTVTCTADTAVGISIEGKGAKVSNGAATGCFTGVDVFGEGKHKVTDMLATGNRAIGFEVVSDGNKLTHNTASRNGFDAGPGDGFRVSGDKNTLTENWGIDNLDEGFEIDGAKVKMTGNVGATNDGEGIRIDNGGGKYKDNLLAGNITGIRVGAEGCTFTSNVAIANTVFEGFFLTQGSGKYTKNVLVGNPDAGMDLTANASNNKISKTLALGNGDFGLEVESPGNSIKSTIAIGQGTDLVDLTGCTNNSWSKSLFGTSNDACIE